MSEPMLRGRRVLIAGAGLAGLTAARELEKNGADVLLAEARNRAGGRVWTLRDGFAHRRHAEAGADLIEGEQALVRELAAELGLAVRRILRAGFGFYGEDRGGRRRILRTPTGLQEATRRLGVEIADYSLAGRRWDSAVAAVLGRTSVAAWLRDCGAPPSLASAMRGLRGFFLADPEDLSLLSLVDQFAASGAPGQGAIFRISGGNDRLPLAMARALRGRILLDSPVRRVRQRARHVIVTVEGRGGRRQIRADCCIVAVPASTLRDIEFDPPLPERQRAAISALPYGAATRVLLQFDRAFWRRGLRPRAFGTDLPVGAVWDGAEDQRSTAVLTLLAGGSASRELQAVIAAEGYAGVVARLKWLGTPARLLAAQAVSWEADPWSRGGYAVFDTSFDPAWREWLHRPAGRVFFAGEHTSSQWQGYMNGAVESGRRAAAEVRAVLRANG